MYKWRIVIILIGSGQVLKCTYSGPENSSSDVFKRIFKDATVNSFAGLGGSNGRSNILVKLCEIAALEIQPWYEEAPDEMP